MAKHNDVKAILCATPGSIDISDWFKPMRNVRFMNCKPFRFPLSRRDVAQLGELERFSPDVIFVPVERSFRFKKVPVVNMVQNMEPFVKCIAGDPFSERIKKLAQYVDAKRAVKRADRVIAITKFVSDFLITDCGVPVEKIGLVYHGIDEKQNNDGSKPDIIPDGWKGRFIFTAGSIRPARGVEDLLSAMNHLNFHGCNKMKLVIAGKSGHRMARYQQKLKDWIQEHNLSSDICWPGHLNDSGLRWCYQNCRAFVMTSRVESFGMIAGEAMAHGCICISADNPCLPEIFGDAALYYPPGDGEKLSAKVKSAMSLNSVERTVISNRAIAQAQKFSWDICAEKTVRELAKAASCK